ncbi:MAG: hypothetical protein A2Y15_03950 [Clostridiales bacterium GWF2_36_10]|nr:MAG: hypothetical protein A2Y15_03950 [Clostridiales bacterium GWF2_36_10]HAN20342.1 hypothetical protein [Clostridiales bacterium]
MDNKRNNNTDKPITNSNKAITTRKNGISASAKTPVGHSAVSQSVGARNIIPKTAVKPVLKKKSGAVVGMKNVRNSSLRAVRSPQIITVRKKERSPFPTAVIFTSVIITALFLFMMMNYAEIDKYNSENAQLSAKITQLENEEANLRVKLDKKDNLVEIEKRATQELGMVKEDTLEHRNINLTREDKIEIVRYNDGEEGGFGFLLTGIGEVIRDFIE